ncbi:hypothetical protein AAC387_Pa10g2214 [Persea americana]
MDGIQSSAASVPTMFRLESSFSDHSYMEKRQLFLRSYHFCRKRSVVERIKSSLIRARRVVWIKLRSARRLRRLVWLKVRQGYQSRRRFRFQYRLISRSSPSPPSGTNRGLGGGGTTPVRY